MNHPSIKGMVGVCFFGGFSSRYHSHGESVHACPGIPPFAPQNSASVKKHPRNGTSKGREMGEPGRWISFSVIPGESKTDPRMFSLLLLLLLLILLLTPSSSSSSFVPYF